MGCTDVSSVVGSTMICRGLKWSTLLVIAFVAANGLLAVLTNVSTHPTDSDKAVFQTLLGLKKPQGPLNYDDEISLIKSLQSLVLKKASGNTPIPEYSDREPEDLLRNQSGLCFDRSRTFDKLFNWYGFETRHLYILYPEHPVTGQKLSLWRAFFTKGTESHAVTEVKTSRGWLVVDSNMPWISLAEDGSPIDADHIYVQANRFATLPEYWDRPYWAIRGMYSRRGQFYRPYIPYPELNWFDFASWLVKG